MGRMVQRLQQLALARMCALGLHYREHKSVKRIQELGQCVNCGETVLEARTSIFKGDSVYPLPPDCQTLIRAYVADREEFKVVRYGNNLMVRPLPDATYLNSLRIIYVQKPRTESLKVPG